VSSAWAMSACLWPSKFARSVCAWSAVILMGRKSHQINSSRSYIKHILSETIVEALVAKTVERVH